MNKLYVVYGVDGDPNVARAVFLSQEKAQAYLDENRELNYLYIEVTSEGDV